MSILKVSQLTKRFGGLTAVSDVNFEFPRGQISAVIGPNGAGKSSLMRTIATLQKPDSGRITFGDIDVLKNQLDLRKVLGYLPQEFGVYPNLSASDLLQYFAKLKGIKSKADRNAIINRVLEVTNLWDVRNKSVSGYSGGMKQRFGIAQLLLNDPKLIIVDEPTAGLDPAERHRFLNVLREIGTDHTVIFSTHIVDDVRELCHELAILNGGKILLRGTPKESIDQLEGKIWVRIISRDQLDEYTQKFNGISTNYNQDNTLNIRVHSDERPDESFVNAQGQLEDVYFVALKNDQRHV